MDIPAGLTIATPRLRLRPFQVGDARRVVEIQSNWNVIRMLRMANFPVTLEATRAWLASHGDEWREGSGYRFAVEFEGRVVGCVDVDEIQGRRGVLGYWFDEAVWGRGLASEAARAAMDWAFEALGLTGLDSGCASDNLASAAVLTRLGFRRNGETRLWSNPRGGEITQLRFTREAGGGRNREGAAEPSTRR
jgi:ribosomal-protein-alanine N-acetyltransferase